MKTVVVDASVACKWVLPSDDESLTGEAARLLDAFVDKKIRFVEPDLFWAELGNIFWKAVRQERWTRELADIALNAMLERNFPTVPSKVLLRQANVIASEFDRSLHDSLYVALALRARGELVTADERLAKALAAHLPVKWLGALG
jgi:predicted nucleic acid-binding protein